ncbi:MerR family transcriptional regulator [Mycobacteroides abscessus]|uniref:MerR family transcriptional regulator n=1 Tax=Mycobacteroides abscessus TaxID=36809 RepID=UPI0009C7E3D9|nr:MerR family transcriptional regulator [Mycobacteroides abscessus]SLJ09292.1 Uncharacterised protein [Mycobacteroides abscessus subsp. abscessus]
MTTANATPTTCEACDAEADELYHNDELGLAVCAECDSAPIEDPAPKPKRTRTPKATPKATTTGPTTREVAEELGTTPQRLRVFLRSQGDRFNPPGTGGGRYAFTKTNVAAIKKAFPAWDARDKKAKADAKSARAAASKIKVTGVQKTK